MLVISNHLLGKVPVPKDSIIRVNLAWYSSVEAARQALDEINRDVYLDYPRGRTKPPKPGITLYEAIELANEYKVRYFAVSNVEVPKFIKEILARLETAEFVPKIETALGVENIRAIIATGVKTLMLDKEDLYVDVDMDAWAYEKLVDSVRQQTNNVTLLELQGVVFA